MLPFVRSHALSTALGLLAAMAAACQAAPEESAASRAMEQTGQTAEGRAEGHPRGHTEAPVEAPPAGTLERSVFDAAARYAKGFELGELRFEGQLAGGEKRSFMLLLRYGRCYRIIGAGGGDIRDLDLVLYDPAELPVQRDLGEDPLPVLGLQAHLCPQQTASYRLEVKAYAGQGPFLVQTLESPN